MDRLRFQFEERPNGVWPAVYCPNSEARTVSANAGDYRWYVGGGSLNKAFAEELAGALRQTSWWDPETGYSTLWGFADLHKLMVTSSHACGGQVSFETPPEEIGDWLHLKSAAGIAGEKDFAGYEGVIGAVILSVFEESWRPSSNENNLGMLYVVGPRGEGSCGPSGGHLSKEDFLRVIENTAERAVELVVTYNTRQKLTTADVVEVIRWPLVSGGVYRHRDVSKVQVATHTIIGMTKAFANYPHADLRVTFTWDEGVFKEAYEKLVLSQA